MKKAVVAASIVILGAGSWTGASWYTGKILEQRIPEELTKFNATIAEYISKRDVELELAQVSYERGVFSSTGHYTLSRPNEQDPSKRLDFDITIDHGPFPTGALAQGHFLPKMGFIDAVLRKTETSAPAFVLTKDQVPIRAEGTVTYSGNVSALSTIAPVDYEDDSVKVNFGGAKLSNHFVRKTREIGGILDIDTLSITDKTGEEPFVVKLDGTKLDATYRPVKHDKTVDAALTNSLNSHDIRSRLTIKSLSADQPKGDSPFALTMQDLSLGGTYQPGSFGFPLYDASFNLHRAEISNLQNDIVVGFDNLRYDITISEDKTNMATGLSYTVDDITINKLSLGKAAIGIKLNNLNGAVIRDAMELYQGASNALAAENPHPLGQLALVSSMSQLAMRLLEANPELRIEPVSLKTDKGESAFSASIVFAKPSNLLGGNSEDIALQSIKSIDAKVLVSKPMLTALATDILVQQTGMAEADAKAQVDDQLSGLGMLEALGFIKQDGDNLVSTFHYADGAGKLNDQEFSAEQIKAMLQEFELGHQSPFAMNDDDDSQTEHTSRVFHTTLNPGKIGDLVEEEFGISYKLDYTADGIPVLTLEPGETHASRLEILFLNCREENDCSDMIARAQFNTPKPVSLKVINQVNRDKRWIRAYQGGKGQAVLEMDFTAYGSISEDTLTEQLDIFFDETHSIAHDLLDDAIKQ